MFYTYRCRLRWFLMVMVSLHPIFICNTNVCSFSNIGSDWYSAISYCILDVKFTPIWQLHRGTLSFSVPRCLSYLSLCEKCPNTEFFLVRIFLYSDWIRRFINLRIHSKYRKIRTRKTPYLGTFHYVFVTHFTGNGNSLWQYFHRIFYEVNVSGWNDSLITEKQFTNILFDKCG